MSLPIKTLPIAERWECASCAKCCRGHVITLDEPDRRRLQEQHWERHPDYRGVPTVERLGWLSRTWRLRQRADGSCVFLRSDGLCAIHKDFGYDAKPLVCRVYPLQLVPRGNHLVLTLRRSCPTAAADRGRELKEYRDAMRGYLAQRDWSSQPVQPPRITRRYRGSWNVALAAAGALETLLTDQRFPLVRRLVHGLRFCDLLAACRLKKLDEGRLRELFVVLREGAPQEVGELFVDRQSPSRAALVLFRQSALEYLRLLGANRLEDTWRERFHLARLSWRMAIGRGEVPRLHDGLPVASFTELERPLGHLPEAVQQPLNRYFEVNAASLQYAVASRAGWPLIDSFRALALSHAIALWLLRYRQAGQPPTTADAIELVTALDRGQGFQPLTSRRHQQRVAALNSLGELDRLLAWYAR